MRGVGSIVYHEIENNLEKIIVKIFVRNDVELSQESKEKIQDIVLKTKEGLKTMLGFEL